MPGYWMVRQVSLLTNPGKGSPSVSLTWNGSGMPGKQWRLVGLRIALGGGGHSKGRPGNYRFTTSQGYLPSQHAPQAVLYPIFRVDGSLATSAPGAPLNGSVVREDKTEQTGRGRAERDR